MKRTVKVQFLDYWADFQKKREQYLLLRILRKHYDVQICDDPDYVFFSVMGEKHWGVPDRCIKICHTGENLVPDFNACDYAIGFDWMEFGDRYLRFPLYYTYGKELNLALENRHLFNEEELRAMKQDFCSITVSNANRNPVFKELFEALSKYKRVNSGGRWMNNVGGPVADKMTFDRRHKFSIACENSASPGYTTEKLVQAFAAKTIPIYWGDPLVSRVFNTKAFINVNDFASVDEVVNRIKMIDNSDELYLQMMREPALVSEAYNRESQMAVLKRFSDNIFCCPKEEAKRRNRIFWGRKYIDLRLTQERRSNSIFFRSYWEKLAKSIYMKYHK